MNAKQAFEEAAAWSVGKDNEAAERGRMERASAHADAADYFARRASEVEAEDAAWTVRVRSLALSVRNAAFTMPDDAVLLAQAVLNAIGEKP